MEKAIITTATGVQDGKSIESWAILHKESAEDWENVILRFIEKKEKELLTTVGITGFFKL